MRLPFIFPKMCTTLQGVCIGVIGFTLGSDLPLAEQPKATHEFIPHVPLLILIYPLSPKLVPHEFLINQ
jgi:hypothetical protein